MNEIDYQQLNIQNKHLLEANKDLSKEIERLNNIIDKAIEYINNDIRVYYVLDTKTNELFEKTNKVKDDLLEILDKVSK